MHKKRLVPPSPDVMAHLFMDYVRDGKPVGLTFAQYLHAIGFTDPSADTDGMDDGATVTHGAEGGPSLISVPKQKLAGRVTIIVLLIDFPDLAGRKSAKKYRDLLFSKGIYPTGSLRDYYAEVSGGKVDINGTVHGWFRMPNPYSYYTNHESGLEDASYPQNAQKMAEDAVAVALKNGVKFPPTLDVLHNGTVTGLFLIHAGRGAEELLKPLSDENIWSHKWNLRTPAILNPSLMATTYLTVPEDCNMGVCAHELGHLAFQWEDFYDTDNAANGQWAGTGTWDLMAGGSWNGFRGDTPAHPIGLHKSQHDWLKPTLITKSATGVTIPPFSPNTSNSVKVVSPAFKATQFLFLENRVRTGFDKAIPGQGLLVWRVDLDRQQVGPNQPAVQLVQADGKAELDQNLNQGDDSDPFPGSENVTSVSDAPGILTTSFPNSPASGVTLSNIKIDQVTGVITLDIAIHGAANRDMTAPAIRSYGVQPSPNDPSVAALKRLLKQETVSDTELKAFMLQVTPTLLDIENTARALPPDSTEKEHAAAPPKKGTKGKKPPLRVATHLSDEAELTESQLFDPSDFGGWLWRRYKNNFNVQWDTRGKFLGNYSLQILGPSQYLYEPDKDNPFRFVRSTGEVIQPAKMITDGGSVPRSAWLIPGIDPWTYFDAYVIHDWDFMVHHCLEGARSFEVANLTLAEGIYTMMMAGKVPADWRKVEVVYRSVSTYVGREVWDAGWSQEQCDYTLPK